MGKDVFFILSVKTDTVCTNLSTLSFSRKAKGKNQTNWLMPMVARQCKLKIQLNSVPGCVGRFYYSTFLTWRETGVIYLSF